MPRNISIQFTARSAVILLAAVAVVWLVTNFTSLLFILFLAILLTVATTPIVERLAAVMPRALAILLVYIALIAVIVAAGGLLVPVIGNELGSLSKNLPKLIQGIANLPNRLVPYFPQLGSTNILSNFSSRIGALVGSAGSLLLALSETLTTVLFDGFLILVTAFFLTAEAQFAPHLIGRFFPPDYRPIITELAHEMGGRLGHWVRAQLLVGLCYGAMFAVGLLILGVPYAFSLGVAGAILELIPYVGGIIVTTIAMIVAVSISPLLALGVLGVQVIVAMIESHVLYPKLVGDIVGLHPIVIIIALFIGAEAQGIVGALLAVPVAVVLQVLFEHFYRFEDTPAPVSAVEESEVTAAPSMAEVRPPLLPRKQ